MESLRIAQIAPLWESVPPQRYGGTERVVHYLSEDLIRRGHRVVLFASGDSRSRGELQSCVPAALRLAGHRGDPQVPARRQLRQVIAQAGRFDILHFHTGAHHFAAAQRLPCPACTRCMVR